MYELEDAAKTAAKFAIVGELEAIEDEVDDWEDEALALWAPQFVVVTPNTFSFVTGAEGDDRLEEPDDWLSIVRIPLMKISNKYYTKLHIIS